MDRFLGNRDTVPGTCPHPTGWDSPGSAWGEEVSQGAFPLRLPISPSSGVSRALLKKIIREKRSRASGEGCWGGFFSPLAGRTVPNTPWGGCSEPRTRCLRLPWGQGLPHRLHVFCALKRQSIMSQRYFSCSPWVVAGSSNISFVPGGGWSSAHQLPPLFLRGHSCHPPVVIPPGSSSPRLHPLQLTRPSHC